MARLSFQICGREIVPYITHSSCYPSIHFILNTPANNGIWRKKNSKKLLLVHNTDFNRIDSSF